MVQVRIKVSKMDPFRQVYLGRTGNDDLCPVRAVPAYLAVRGNSPGEELVSRVRAALIPHGVDTLVYSGHSFRIGAATTAAVMGLEDLLIKTLGMQMAELCLFALCEDTS